ncbi:unnamed protein product [Parnassius apollo]|uniref:(apollo) hypothetical protein n=1 Tax=Parnassius apollo TaxID=110799 RepID=A0A8S3XJX8_PARAO|nr:unnamed protein product [Parnassius apollo]
MYRDPEWISRTDDSDTSDTTDKENIISDPKVQNINNQCYGKIKRSRKRIADPSEWNDIKNKHKRELVQ